MARCGVVKRSQGGYAVGAALFGSFHLSSDHLPEAEKVTSMNGTSRIVNTWHLLILQVFFWPFCGEQ